MASIQKQTEFQENEITSITWWLQVKDLPQFNPNNP